LDPKWYSHKFSKPGVTYEIAVDLFESKIAWVHGPFPAGQNDLSVFRKEEVGLKWKIPAGKKVIADNGCQGAEASEMLSTPNDVASRAVKQFKKRARARHETVNKKLKQYAILENRFRHGCRASVEHTWQLDVGTTK
jgi:DDE superfamily endonuclease